MQKLAYSGLDLHCIDVCEEFLIMRASVSLNSFTPDSTKSKINKFSKIKICVKLMVICRAFCVLH